MIARRVGRAAVAVAVFVGMSMSAQARCSSAADQAAFEVGALKSELSVLAVGCSDEEDYNHFVERARTELVAEDAVVNAWFRKTYGRAAQAKYDSYITLLANEQSVKGQHEGSDFCPRLKPVFAETAFVPAKSLPQYAAAKDLLPLDNMACEVGTTTVAARGGKSSTTHTTATRKKK